MQRSRSVSLSRPALPAADTLTVAFASFLPFSGTATVWPSVHDGTDESALTAVASADALAPLAFTAILFTALTLQSGRAASVAPRQRFTLKVQTPSILPSPSQPASPS